MNFYINNTGITENPPLSHELPNQQQIDFCKSILSLVSEKTKFSNDTSYGHKHILEKYFPTHYITNGAFIQAAEDLDFAIERADYNSPNACFKFSSEDIQLALFNYLSLQHTFSINESISHNIIEKLQQCYIKSGKTTLGEIQNSLKHFSNLDISIQDLFKIIKKSSLSLIPKFDYTQHFDISTFGACSTVNISSSKLINLLFTK